VVAVSVVECCAGGCISALGDRGESAMSAKIDLILSIELMTGFLESGDLLSRGYRRDNNRVKTASLSSQWLRRVAAEMEMEMPERRHENGLV
jgi:hypothetical protein